MNNDCFTHISTVFFDKAQCGVDFLLNTGVGEEISNYYNSTISYKSDFFELLFFRESGGYIWIEENKIEVKKNSIIFISPYQKHRYQIKVKGNDFSFLLFQEDFLHDFLANKYFTYSLLFCYQNEFMPVLEVSDSEMSEYCTLLQKIKKELQGPIKDSEDILRSMLYLLLLQINRSYGLFYGLDAKRLDNSFAYQYRLLLEKHIDTVQRVGDYAEMIGVSRITLNKAVMAQFGVSAIRMLKKRLLAEVKSVLLNSDKTIAQIADDLNFSEPNHLMRFFKMQTTKTISQFMIDYQNGISS